MKKSELFFSFIQVPIDGLMIILAAITAFWAHSFLDLDFFKTIQFSFEDYLFVIFILMPFFLAVFAIEGLYNIRSTRKLWKEILKVFTATTASFVIIIVGIFFNRAWFSSRFILVAAWMLAIFYLVGARFLLQIIQKWLLTHRQIGVHKVLLIGSNGKAYQFKKMLKNKPQLGYKVIGQLKKISFSEIKKLKNKKGLDGIILATPSITQKDQEKLIDYCAINNVEYKYIPTTLQTKRIDTGVLFGEPIISIRHTPLDGWWRIIKRIFDIIGSLFLIIISSPILLITAILIKLEDPDGPVIYKNERVGFDGEKFYVYKFRYMRWKYNISRENPDFKKAIAFEKKLIKERSIRQGPLYKIKNDPRKTKIGSFIEKYSIDEFPQFFNALLGNMSLVGPRPHQKREVEKYKDYHHRLLTIKPGITGMAQVSGRSDLDFEDEYKLDVFYIENWSLMLDLMVLIKTVGVLLKRRKN